MGCDVGEKACADHRCRTTRGDRGRAGATARLDLQRSRRTGDTAAGAACAAGTPDAAGNDAGATGAGGGTSGIDIEAAGSATAAGGNAAATTHAATGN